MEVTFIRGKQAVLDVRNILLVVKFEMPPYTREV